jgi:TM2 domain-containing membrane protein YozV
MATYTGPGNPIPPDRGQANSKKMAAGICGILLGGLGVHKFILGYNTPGIIMLVVFLACSTSGACLIIPLLGSMAMSVIGVVEGIIYLTKSDDDFYQTHMVGKREWF